MGGGGGLVWAKGKEARSWNMERDGTVVGRRR